MLGDISGDAQEDSLYLAGIETDNNISINVENAVINLNRLGYSDPIARRIIEALTNATQVPSGKVIEQFDVVMLNKDRAFNVITGLGYDRPETMKILRAVSALKEGIER